MHSCLGLTKVPHSTICIAGIGTSGGVKSTIKYIPERSQFCDFEGPSFYVPGSLIKLYLFLAVGMSNLKICEIETDNLVSSN